MSAFVVDASVAATWLFEDEKAAPTDALLDAARVSGATAPTLWRFETANLIAMGRRRLRAEDHVLDRMATVVDALPVSIDRDSDSYVFDTTYALSVKHSLTVYDAAYLDLAMRRGLPLATLDKGLRRAASAEGVALLP